jgi:hypothetical protein
MAQRFKSLKEFSANLAPPVGQSDLSKKVFPTGKMPESDRKRTCAGGSWFGQL